LTPEDAFASQLPTTGAAADPVSMVMADLGCTEADARWLVSAWNALKVPLAGRVVQTKQYAGKFADLKALVTSMLPEPSEQGQQPVDTAADLADAKAQDKEVAAAEGQAEPEKPKRTRQAKPAVAPKPDSSKFGF